MSKYIKQHNKAINVYINEINADLPEIQREQNINKVKDIYDFQNSYYIQHNSYLILGAVTIVSFEKSCKEYLIDGQHRIAAFKMLQKDYPERKINIAVDYLSIKNIDKDTDCKIVEDLYELVNTCTPNPITGLGADRYKIIQGLKKYFTQNFKEYLKTTSNPQKPHINLEKLCDYIINNNVIDKLDVHSADELINMIVNLNRHYSTLLPEQFEKFGVPNPSDLIYKIHNYSNLLYLGMYNKFEWVDRIVEAKIHNKEYNELKHISYNFRPKIPVSLRRKVWNNKFMKGECFCCKERIEFDDFQCGHIIPVSLGGVTNAENLRPLCARCNRDMGNMHMNDYMNLLML